MKRRAPLVLWLLFALATVGIGWFFHADYDNQTRHVVRQNSVALEVAYRASIGMYRLDVETRFKQQILRDKVLDLLERANRATPDELPLLRGWLYRALRADYLDIEQTGLRQLHFHFPDGRSLLRFHSPAHLGDPSLFDIRPSVRIANTELRPAVGFEGGRILPGFRYVFPILRAGSHLGSVELSLPFERIHQNLLKLLPVGDYALLLQRHTVEMAFADQRDKFVPADIHPDYFKENTEISAVSRAFVQSKIAQQLSALLRHDAGVQAGMSAGTTFAVPVLHEGKGYIAAFHAIRDLDEKHAAYVVGYSEAPVLIGIRAALLREAAIVFVLLLLLTLMAAALLRQRQRLAEEKSRLLTITATLGDGLYVIDAQGKTVFVNRACCELTGYRQDELLGNSAHDLIHRHEGNEYMPAAQCPIGKTACAGVTYHGEQAFAAKGGRIFPVEVDSQPLIEQNGRAGAVILFRDITARKQMETELQHLATTDPLTGIGNRRHFMQQLAVQLDRVERYGEPAALLMLDLDLFKRVNDRYGHAVGDAVLRHCVDLTRQRLRSPDIFGRLGGEEFGVLLPHTDLAGACEFAENLRQQVAATPCPGPAGPIEITLSIGIARCGADGFDPDSVLAQADRALYRAKAAGRNRVVVDVPEDNQAVPVA